MVHEPSAPHVTSAPEAPGAGTRAPVTPVGSTQVGAVRANHTPAAWWLVAVVLAVLTTAATVFAWNTQQRVKGLERELVKRQEDSGTAAAEARLLARQAQEGARDVAAKLALVEARVSESSLQRSQLEELMQSLSRSRDENVLADVDAALRVAMQLTALTGSAEPLLGALRQAEERLARYSQPRLERVRRALAHDLERAKGAGLADVAGLSIRLDEAVRLVDSLPLIAVPEGRGGVRDAVAAPAPTPAGSAPAAKAPGMADQFRLGLEESLTRFWGEVRALVRVTRIDHPEAMLSAPDQTFFLRENLKLRLLNARLALLSRQFESAQGDLRVCQDVLVKYFDPQARRTQSAVELLRQVQAQARAVNLPRPDETLAAIAAAGR